MANKSKKKLPHYKAEFVEGADNLINMNIVGLGLVDNPAHELQFRAFGESKLKFASTDNYKQNLMGVAIRVNHPMYRFNEATGEEYMLSFDETNAYKFMKDWMMKQNTVTNLNHDESTNTDQNKIIEIWQVEDAEKDKSALYPELGANKGDIMVTLHVSDKKTFEKALKGEIKGFSIEAYFDEIYAQFDQYDQEQKIKNKDDMKKEIKELLKSIFTDAAKAIELPKLQKFMDLQLASGDLVEIDEETKAAKIGDQPAPAGEHVLADGRVLVIDEAGLMVEIKDAASAEPATDPANEEMKFTSADLEALKAEFKSEFEKINANFTNVKNDYESKIAKFNTENTALKKEIADLKTKLSNVPAVEKFEKKEDKTVKKNDVMPSHLKFQKRYMRVTEE